MANTRHTTTTRRASIARFRHEIARGHLDVFLVRADDPLTTPLLSNARAHWFAQIETRKVCIFCKRSFTADDVQPGLFLLASYRQLLLNVTARQQARRREAQYDRPDWPRTIRALEKGPPATVADLHALFVACRGRSRDSRNTD